LQLICIGIIGVASHQRGPARECKLRVAFGEHLFGALVTSDVSGHTKQFHGSALIRIAHDRALNCNPARLAGMRVIKRGNHAEFGPPGATGANCFCESCVGAHEVISMDEALRLFNRRGWHVMSVNSGGTRVALETAGG